MLPFRDSLVDEVDVVEPEDVLPGGAAMLIVVGEVLVKVRFIGKAMVENVDVIEGTPLVEFGVTPNDNETIAKANISPAAIPVTKATVLIMVSSPIQEVQGLSPRRDFTHLVLDSLRI